jgi:hypothetical protein
MERKQSSCINDAHVAHDPKQIVSVTLTIDVGTIIILGEERLVAFPQKLSKEGYSQNVER